MSARKSTTLTLEERLRFGNLSISEVIALKSVSAATFYADVKAGKVAITKHGQRSLVAGPIAAKYIAGEPIAA
jgi:hypothetical protein